MPVLPSSEPVTNAYASVTSGHRARAASTSTPALYVTCATVGATSPPPVATAAAPNAQPATNNPWSAESAPYEYGFKRTKKQKKKFARRREEPEEEEEENMERKSWRVVRLERVRPCVSVSIRARTNCTVDGI